jgi:uncharacterized damage-inducible protein DinB
MAAAFRTVRTNTIQVAEDIPEDKYGWAPVAGTRTIQSVLAHIAGAPALHEELHRVQRVTTLEGFDWDSLMGRMMAEEAKPRTKRETIDFLRSEGERFAAWLESLSAAFLAETYLDPMGQNPKSRMEGLLSAKEHEMHHRAQLMLAQRMLGIVPHLTRRMQERMAAHAAAKR